MKHGGFRDDDNRDIYSQQQGEKMMTTETFTHNNDKGEVMTTTETFTHNNDKEESDDDNKSQDEESKFGEHDGIP